MEARTIEVESGFEENSGWPRNILIFLTTLIATLVLGSTPDVDGLVSWILTRSPVAGVCSARGDQA